MLKTRVCILDAGPLIHLDELDALRLLAELGQVYTTETVAAEVERHRPGAVERAGVVVFRDVKSAGARITAVVSDFHLDPGELSALMWAEEFGIDLFVSDDTEARGAAAALGYLTIGTIGVILEGMTDGHITRREAIGLLEAIPERSTLHVQRRFLEKTIARIR